MFQCSSFVYPKDDFFVVFYVVELLIFDFDSKIMRFISLMGKIVPDLARA
jgi:hypothetical protein